MIVAAHGPILRQDGPPGKGRPPPRPPAGGPRPVDAVPRPGKSRRTGGPGRRAGPLPVPPPRSWTSPGRSDGVPSRESAGPGRAPRVTIGDEPPQSPARGVLPGRPGPSMDAKDSTMPLPFALAIVLPCLAAEAPTPARVGDAAPPIAAVAADGNAVLNSHLQGRVVLLTFWKLDPQAGSGMPQEALRSARAEFREEDDFLILTVGLPDDEADVLEDWTRFRRPAEVVRLRRGPDGFPGLPEVVGCIPERRGGADHRAAIRGRRPPRLLPDRSRRPAGRGADPPGRDPRGGASGAGPQARDAPSTTGRPPHRRRMRPAGRIHDRFREHPLRPGARLEDSGPLRSLSIAP